MNCRGLTELVVLNIGLDLGVLSPDLFAIMVLMALFTTALASPVVTSVQASSISAHEPADEADDELIDEYGHQEGEPSQERSGDGEPEPAGRQTSGSS
jgi:hypothetical protein